MAAAAVNAAQTPGTSWSRGENTHGEPGAATTTTCVSGGPVNGLSVVDLHGGREYVVAVRPEGTVWVSRSTSGGQLGLRATADVVTPTRIPGSSGVGAVTTGHHYTLALTSDGTVWASGLEGHIILCRGTTMASTR